MDIHILPRASCLAARWRKGKRLTRKWDPSKIVYKAAAQVPRVTAHIAQNIAEISQQYYFSIAILQRNIARILQEYYRDITVILKCPRK